MLAWKAPRPGRVAITGAMNLNGNPTGDGLRTVIKKQTGSAVTKIWPS